MRYFLASKSPRRRELLKYLIDDFEVDSAEIDEILTEDNNIESQLMSLAFQKARALDIKLQKNNKINAGDIIIGSDTIVYLDGILQKPKDEQDAIQMLQKMSDKKHTVYTSIAVIKSQMEKSIVDISKTDVYFKKLTEKEIIDYVKCGEPMDKAGSYGIQGKGAKFIQRIEGDYYSVMGLPLSLLHDILKKMEYNFG